MTEKPDVLSDEQIVEARIAAYAQHGLPATDICRCANIEDRGIAQAQRDDTWKKAQAIYFPIMNESIAQARQDTAREIFELVQEVPNPYIVTQQQYYGFERATRDIRQSLKEKYLKEGE